MDNNAIDFIIARSEGNNALQRGDMKTALDCTETCITLVANNNGIYDKQFHEIAYKSYMELSKRFFVTYLNKEGAKESINKAIKHYDSMYNTTSTTRRQGLKTELIAYSKNLRPDFPME